MAAAVADFRPAAPERDKLVREPSGELDLRLEPTDDVLAAVAQGKREDQTVVGFAAEHGGDPVGRARAKLERKRVDAIVVNDVSRPEIGFESAENEVVIVERGAATEVPLSTKDDVAEAILDRVDALRAGAGAPRSGA
jgi:phosphopantothenoylcysteine decarboxylase/phosphopantothenate--cysteine ligase